MPCKEDDKDFRYLGQLLAGPIYKSVGVLHGGAGPATNLAMDVALVQSLLNLVAKVPAAKRKIHYDKKPVPTAKGLPAASGIAAKSTPPLPVNGTCDRTTIERIKAFQAEFLSSKPDGRIDPHSPTWKKLVKVSGVTPNSKNKKEITFGTDPKFVRTQVDRARLKEMTKRHLGLVNRNERIADFLKLLFADPTVKKLQWLAYYLATAYHETEFTFKPVGETGKGSKRGYGKKVVSVTDTHGYRGAKGKVYRNVYYSQGFVQLTKEPPYKYFPRQVTGLREDELYIDPDQASEFETSYKILTYWMQNDIPRVKSGKRKLQDYMSKDALKYKEARVIVNANDCAVRIANYARVFEMMLILSTRR